MKLRDVGLYSDPTKDGLDSDTSVHIMPATHSPVDRKRGQYGRMNCRTNKYGLLENILGSAEVTNTIDFSGNILINGFSLPAGENKCIGKVKDIENDGIIWLNYNSTGKHGIYRYLIGKNAVQTILLQNTALYPTFTGDLNFSLSYIIVSIIIVDGKLIWTEDYNEIRELDIAKCYDFTNNPIPANKIYSSITNDHFTFIRRPPVKLVVAYQSDSAITINNLRGKLFQFKTRFVYRDNSKSSASPASKVPLPIKEETVCNEFTPDIKANNVINIVLDTGTELVKSIEVHYRIGNTGMWYIYDTIEKFDESGSRIIADNIPYTYHFYNNRYATADVQEELTRNYNNVPNKAATLDLVEGNRIVFGNCTMGMDNVDIDVSLADEVTTGYITSGVNCTIETFGGFPSTVIQAIILPDVSLVHLGDTIFLKIQAHAASVDTDIYYVFSYVIDDVSSYPDNAVDNLISQINATTAKSSFYASTLFGFPYRIEFNTGGILPYRLPIDGLGYCYELQIKEKTFKKGSYPEFGIVYYDEYGRHGGVNTNDDCRIYIPCNSEALPLKYDDYMRHHVRMTIQHEAPANAKYYQIVYARRQYYFLKFYIDTLTRSLYKTADMKYTGQLAIKFDNVLDSHFLDRYGNLIIQPYVWQRGDRIRIYSQELTFSTINPAIVDYNDYEIDGIATVSSVDYILIKDFNYEDFGIDRYSLCEIYRPIKEQTNESTIFYEVGEIGDITYRNGYYCHDALDNIYSVTQDIANGVNGEAWLEGYDCFLKFRTSKFFMFPVEEVNLSDCYTSDVHDIGRLTVIDRLQSNKKYKSLLIHGERFFDGTSVNNLFDVKLYNNSEILDDTDGAIRRIIFRGYTLKVFQDHKRTSIYINKRILSNADGSSNVVATDKVFASINPYGNNYGCINPESIVSNDKYIYFVDILNGAVIRDAYNGDVVISDYLMRNYHRDLRDYALNKTFTQSTKEELVSLFFPAVFDVESGEYFYDAQIKKWFTYSPALPILITTTETPVFSEETNRWKYFKYNTNASIYDYFEELSGCLMYWKDGIPYVERKNTNYCEFNGVKMPHTIAIVGNGQLYGKDKVFNSLELRTNNNNPVKSDTYSWYADVYVFPTRNYIAGMYSQLNKERFITKENGLYTEFLRDMNTPSDKDYLWKLMNGRELRGETIEITLTNYSDNYVYLSEYFINSTESHSGY